MIDEKVLKKKNIQVPENFKRFSGTLNQSSVNNSKDIPLKKWVNLVKKQKADKFIRAKTERFL